MNDILVGKPRAFTEDRWHLDPFNGQGKLRYFYPLEESLTSVLGEAQTDQGVHEEAGPPSIPLTANWKDNHENLFPDPLFKKGWNGPTQVLLENMGMEFIDDPTYVRKMRIHFNGTSTSNQYVYYNVTGLQPDTWYELIFTGKVEGGSGGDPRGAVYMDDVLHPQIYTQKIEFFSQTTWTTFRYQFRTTRTPTDARLIVSRYSTGGNAIFSVTNFIIKRTNTAISIPQTGTINYSKNPTFDGTYSGGIAPSWSAYSSGTGAGTRSESRGYQIIDKTDGGVDRWGVQHTTDDLGAPNLHFAHAHLEFFIITKSTGSEVRFWMDFRDSGGTNFGAKSIVVDLDAYQVGERISVKEYYDVLTDLGDEWRTVTLYVWVEDANAKILVTRAGIFQNYSSWFDGDSNRCSWQGTAYQSASDYDGTMPIISKIITNYKQAGTIALWTNVDYNAEQATIDSKTEWYICKLQGGSYLALYAPNASSMNLRVNFAVGGTNDYSLGASISGWRHVAITWDDSLSTATLYHNGVAVATYSGIFGHYYSNSGDGLYIPSDVSNDANYPGTDFSQLYIAERVLSATEILNLYNNGASSLVA